MSRYIVRIVGPSGMERYLRRGREVSEENATRFSSPSAACYAACRYQDTHPTAKFIVDTIDIRDPERQV